MKGKRASRSPALLTVSTAIVLLVATTAVARGQAPSAPPYLQTGAHLISIGLSFDEAALRRLLPAAVRPAPGLTGGINVYQVPTGYPFAPYSAAYVWADVVAARSAAAVNGRWMLHGVYGPDGVAAALRERLGFPARGGVARLETTERGTRGIGVLGDRTVISSEISASPGPCSPVRGVVNYLSLLGPQGRLVLNAIAYAGEACHADPVAARVESPQLDAADGMGPVRVLWARELRSFAFAFGDPRPVE